MTSVWRLLKDAMAFDLKSLAGREGAAVARSCRTRPMQPNDRHVLDLGV
ncbi:hypothetical protein PATSB16_24400 [Pandoraea thiooxydans]|nr:hypothetical protein PATSB16_24400 [Pandoraea thiooxydans]